VIDLQGFSEARTRPGSSSTPANVHQPSTSLKSSPVKSASFERLRYAQKLVAAQGPRNGK
jgi:hypothetical protein